MAPARDQPWARTAPARVLRELVLRGVFGPIIWAYSHREIAGREHLDGLSGPVIFVANHCSHVDTPLALLALPIRWRRHTVVAAAADYFYTSRALAATVSLAFGTVPIERRGHGVADAAHIARLLGNGWSLLVFAEGTRSRDGRVGRMRSGAAVLAAEHGLPIVPVHIAGTHQAMPIGRRWMVRPPDGGRWGRHALSVSFGAPLRVEEPAEAMERVHEFMASCGRRVVEAPRAPEVPHQHEHA